MNKKFNFNDTDSVCEHYNDYYKNIFSRFFDVGDLTVYAGKINNLMKKGRQERVIPIPDNFKELAESIGGVEFVKNFYRGFAEDEDGGICLIFILNTMMKALRTAKHLLADGTFAVLPRIPLKFAQLYTIHFKCFKSVRKHVKVNTNYFTA